MKSCTPFVAIAVILTLQACAGSPQTSQTRWRAHNRAVKVIDEHGRQFIRLDARSDDGVAWLVGATLSDGTIEADLRGKDIQGQSFIGIAFHGVDDTHYDAVYFRPFNFKTDDPGRALHGVQYISLPSFPWSKLRSESPGKYEKPVSPAPGPNDWFHARVVLAGKTVNVYVNGSTTPALTIAALSEAQRGMVGLYVGNGSPGDFANLSLTAAH